MSHSRHHESPPFRVLSLADVKVSSNRNQNSISVSLRRPVAPTPTPPIHPDSPVGLERLRAQQEGPYTLPLANSLSSWRFENPSDSCRPSTFCPVTLGWHDSKALSSTYSDASCPVSRSHCLRLQWCRNAWLTPRSTNRSNAPWETFQQRVLQRLSVVSCLRSWRFKSRGRK